MRPQLFADLFERPPTLSAEVANAEAREGQQPLKTVTLRGEVWNGKEWVSEQVGTMNILTAPFVLGLGEQSGFIVDPWRARRQEVEVRDAVNAIEQEQQVVVEARPRRRL